MTIICGAILFGVGFGMFDTNNMPILCQFVSPAHRAAAPGPAWKVGRQEQAGGSLYYETEGIQKRETNFLRG